MEFFRNPVGAALQACFLSVIFSLLTFQPISAETVSVTTFADVNGVFFDGAFDGNFLEDDVEISVGDNAVGIDFDPFGIVYFDLRSANISGVINSVHLTLSLGNVSLGQATNLNVVGFIDDGAVSPSDAIVTGTQLGFATPTELIADSTLEIDLTSAFPADWTDELLAFRLQFPDVSGAPEQLILFTSLEGNSSQAARLVFNVSAIPEPSTLLFLCGIGLVGARAHFRRANLSNDAA